MVEAFVAGFFRAKLRNVETSKALYFVADDVGGAEIAQRLAARSVKAVAAMLECSGVRFNQDVETMAATIMAAMTGVSRRMLEGNHAPVTVAAMREGLEVMVCSYVSACVTDSNRSAQREVKNVSTAGGKEIRLVKTDREVPEI
jgi:serine/threonine protein phosphatase PrpC